MEKFDKAYIESIVPQEISEVVSPKDYEIVVGEDLTKFIKDLQKTLKKFGLYSYWLDDENHDPISFIVSKKNIGSKNAEKIFLKDMGFEEEEETPADKGIRAARADIRKALKK